MEDLIAPDAKIPRDYQIVGTLPEYLQRFFVQMSRETDTFNTKLQEALEGYNNGTLSETQQIQINLALTMDSQWCDLLSEIFVHELITVFPATHPGKWIIGTQWKFGCKITPTRKKRTPKQSVDYSRMN